MKIKAKPCFGQPKEPWIVKFITRGWIIKDEVRVLWEEPAFYASAEGVFPAWYADEGLIGE